jgi:hypothetical protein
VETVVTGLLKLWVATPAGVGYYSEGGLPSFRLLTRSDTARGKHGVMSTIIPNRIMERCINLYSISFQGVAVSLNFEKT